MPRPVVSVILSGGAGTRLWPVSRVAAPKPFMQIRGVSLLRLTIERCAAVAGFSQALIVTNAAYARKTRDELAGLPVSDRTALLLEPAGRNTAPAVALAALWIAQQHGPDAVMLVLPADHLIENTDAFASAVKAACYMADRGKLCLFGVQPTAPETGFGYMELGARLDDTDACMVQRFVEKPDRATAQRYLDAGNFVWNSGMFCFTAATILQAMRDHAPDVLSAAEAVMRAATASGNDVVFAAESFDALPDISIDYAVMERAHNVVAVQCDLGWSDIGTWNAVAATSTTDAHGNAAEGAASLVDTQGTYVRSSSRLVAAVGVRDLVIVETPDAVLVTHKDASQQVKAVVDQLRAAQSPLALEHATVERPWGTYTTLNEGERFKIKRIEVKPGNKLSLQMHHHRSEHWVVVSGTAQVTCDDRTFMLSPNESTFIPIGARHRLENPGKLPLVVIEVQSGDYVGEDDIVRFSDQYGRVA